MIGLGMTLGLGQARFGEAGQAVPEPWPAGTAHIVLLGQSEPHRLFRAIHADMANVGTVDDEDALEVWWYDLDARGGFDGARRDPITNANKVSRWAVEMSNALAALAPGVAHKLCLLAFSGTGLGRLLEDGEADEARFWADDSATYDLFVADTGINAPDGAFMAWQNEDSALLQFQLGDAWWTALTGTSLADGSAVPGGATRHAVTFDHVLSELWDTETVPFSFLMHRYDQLSGGAMHMDRFRDVRVSIDRMVASARNAARAVLFERGVDPVVYENGYDISDAAHPAISEDGAAKYAQQIAYNIARLGGATLPKPELNSVTWTEAALTLSSSAGPLTTARRIRGGALPAGQPKVAQLYFRRAEAAETLHEVPDAAISLSGGTVTVDAASLLTALGAARTGFLRGDMIEFASAAAGANDTQDQSDDTWLDYPGLAHPVLELLPLQPRAGVLRCDLGAAPGHANALMELHAWAASKGLTDQGEGWYPAPNNTRFDSNTPGEVDLSGLTSGTCTFYMDVDRALGGDGERSTQITARDVSGVGFQRVTVNDIWGEVSLSAAGTAPSDFGWIPIGPGRIRVWAHVANQPGGRVMLYINSNNTGGAIGGAGLFDGALSRAEIAAF
ncbi:MAG: hypothetical protein AAGH73_05285 [Pseudomonadota bacterium]